MKTKLSASTLVLALASLLASGCSDKSSNPMSADQQPSQPPATSSGISFQVSIKPIFQTHGCASCHGGNGGLFVNTVAQLLQGGNHGPAVVPGKADSSNIIKKLNPNPPFGERMPRGGPYLPDSTIQVIKTWINQGAKDN